MDELIKALERKLRTAEDAADALAAYEDMLRDVNTKSGVLNGLDCVPFVYFSQAGDGYLVLVDEDGIYDITPIAVFGQKAAV